MVQTDAKVPPKPEMEKWKTHGFAAFDPNPDDPTPMRIKRRMWEREQWDAYWQLHFLKVKDNFLMNFAPVLTCYYLIDRPVSWFREWIVEPLQDRFGKKYYQRRFNRVPEIDMCGVMDWVREAFLRHIPSF